MGPLFVACAPGLEALLEAELGALGVAELRREAGGVSSRGDVGTVMRLNLLSGLGTHVLLRVGSFDARHFSALVKRTSRLPWSTLLAPNTRWVVRATCRRSKLYHSAAVAERVEAAIASALGRENPKAGPEIGIAVRLDRDRCVVSIDTSGAPLHRRGWRLQTAKAPLREDLAHALVVASGWDRRAPLVDPFAGSGTIAIEAACIARGLAPGRLRDFAFEHTALMDPARWASIRGEAEGRAKAAPGPIFARDRNAGAIAATTGNAARAGVADDVHVQQADLSAEPLPAVAGLTLVTNPPYGQRVRGAGGAWSALERRIAEADVARVAIVAPVEASARLSTIALTKQRMTDHGGTKVAFLVGARDELS